MSKLFVFFVLFCSVSFGLNAQKAKPKGKAPVRKTASKTKGKTSNKIKTNGDDEYDLFICYEGGGPCTFTLLKGDTLVYDVKQQGSSYKLFVVPNKFDANTIADYNWFTSAPDSKTGKVQILSSGLLKGNKYSTNLQSGDLKIADGSTLWLSQLNFKEIASGKTKMIIDGGVGENFSSPQADESNVTIAYKNKEITLEGFAIQNKNIGETGRKELTYLNISSNLLLLKMDLENSSMILKEVRQNSSRK